MWMNLTMLLCLTKSNDEPGGRGHVWTGVGLCAPGDEEPVKPEQDECPDQRHHKARGLVWAVPSDRPPEPAAEHGADDAQHNGHNNTAWVAPRHHQLGEGADNQP